MILPQKDKITQPPLKTIIIRHRRENLKKCSLRGLETRSDLVFLKYPLTAPLNLRHALVLTLDAPPLSACDKEYPLCLIDGTWRLAQKMIVNLPLDESIIYRSLPKEFRTAYPRRQEDCSDPEHGLASVEALYIAHRLLERECEGLLTHYYWKDAFLKKNKQLFESLNFINS